MICGPVAGIGGGHRRLGASRHADGRCSLVIVSDNNFGAGQFTQFVFLGLDIDRVK